MHKQHILRLTLFISVLAMNPAVAQVNLRTDAKSALSQQTQEKQSIHEEIATALEAKGLEAEAAREITQAYLSESGVQFDVMVQNIAKEMDVSKSEIITYLGNEALFRKEADLTSYDALLKMISSITQRTPDASMRTKLKQLSKYHSNQTA